jgi:hypothetical protein
LRKDEELISTNPSVDQVRHASPSQIQELFQVYSCFCKKLEYDHEHHFYLPTRPQSTVGESPVLVSRALASRKSVDSDISGASSPIPRPGPPQHARASLVELLHPELNDKWLIALTHNRPIFIALLKALLAKSRPSLAFAAADYALAHTYKDDLEIKYFRVMALSRGRNYKRAELFLQVRNQRLHTAPNYTKLLHPPHPGHADNI